MSTIRCFVGQSLLVLAIGCLIGNKTRAAIIWTGPSISFTNAPGSDPTQPQNQDRLTPGVWLTRGTAQGIYNAASESGFTHFFSPADTQWANGTTADYASLSYSDWNTWSKGVNGGPPGTVGVNAVMHLVAEDIYLDVQFTDWGGLGGGFSYVRSTPVPSPEPSSCALIGVGLAAGLFRRPRSR